MQHTQGVPDVISYQFRLSFFPHESCAFPTILPLVSGFVKFLFVYLCVCQGRRRELMVSTLVSGSSGPGSSPDRGHCVVILGKTIYSHNAYLQPGV